MEPSPLEFPCDHALKVMGRNAPEFRERMLAVLTAELGAAATIAVQERRSGDGTFLSLTLTVRVESRPQLEHLYRALHATGLVLFAL